jgi:hypothetical protein
MKIVTDYETLEKIRQATKFSKQAYSSNFGNIVHLRINTSALEIEATNGYILFYDKNKILEKSPDLDGGVSDLFINTKTFSLFGAKPDKKKNIELVVQGANIYFYQGEEQLAKANLVQVNYPSTSRLRIVDSNQEWVEIDGSAIPKTPAKISFLDFSFEDERTSLEFVLDGEVNRKSFETKNMLNMSTTESRTARFSPKYFLTVVETVKKFMKKDKFRLHCSSHSTQSPVLNACYVFDGDMLLLIMPMRGQ